MLRKEMEIVVEFEVLMMLSMKMAVFWVVPPCRLASVYHYFIGLYCLHHQGSDVHLDDGGSANLCNVGKLIPVYTVLQHKGQPSLWKVFIVNSCIVLKNEERKYNESKKLLIVFLITENKRSLIKLLKENKKTVSVSDGVIKLSLICHFFSFILYIFWTYLIFSFYVSDIYAEEEYVCTPKSLVIVSVLILLLINVSMVIGFTVFYRVRKKFWKSGDSSGHKITPVTVPEVLFRSVYGQLPPNPSFANLGHQLST
jgi:hypothetical protein